ncbi:hypothetical protein [Winogradskyella immobilis]|uniref:Bulb-type lectin domain-containing protein n=1 Tax=Winogradskyella immobilis TaxID=2816852 RepID=A0ABS8EJD3_9FLAO|nr:hypothetical protein [Winogradskyella immobilis]MCC1483319.1 hypothetical protein [Winogradskyella immobilis]MCG0015413.1 hypothetical protein [Winogradskyella immobilis]
MSLIKYLGVILCVIFSCSSNDDGNSSPDITNGTIDFSITLGGSLNDSAQSVINTTDGGYAILGFTQSIDGDVSDKQNENFDYWVLKFDAQDQLQWSRTYGGSSDDRGQDIIQTQDGGYAIIGSSLSNDGDVSNNAGMEDYWLVKLDASGAVSWQKSFGFQGNDSGFSVIQTNDQGYLISGILDVSASGGQGNSSRTSNRHAGGEYWAIRLNASGDMLWSKFFGGSFTDMPEGIVETDDNGFIIVGGSDSFDIDITNNLGSYDFWIIKISDVGDLLWEKSFGGDEIDQARAIVKSGDGNFVIAGDTRSNSNDVSNNNGAADLWLIKISPEGELIWERTIGGSSFDVSRSIKRTRDNGFILAGSSRSSDIDVSENKGQNDAWVLKVDSNGNLQWERSIGGSNIDFAYGIAELNDNTIVVVGDTASNDQDITENRGFTDMLLIKML